MKRIALTGGIGCGKTTVGNMFKKHGVNIIDTDEISHTLQKNGTTVFDNIVEAFGNEILGNDGEIDRKVLGKIVFNDKSKLNILNGIMHPEIRENYLTQLTYDSDFLYDDRSIVDVPLLFETGMNEDFDFIICVGCTVKTQLDRLLKKRNMTEEDAMVRINAQMDIFEKMNRSNIIIWTDSGDLDNISNQVYVIWRYMKGNL